MLAPFRMVCRDFILPEPASYVFLYALFNLRKLLYLIDEEDIISQPRIKNDALCFDISDKIVVDVNVAFLVIVHGIAFADLNFLNQANQRGTV